MNIEPITTRVFNQGENLLEFIASYIPKIADGSILAVTSKIVALAENRAVGPDEGLSKEEAILAESEMAVKTKHVWLTIKDGMFMASAGIDESNANGKMILLPVDSFAVAADLRKKIMVRYKLTNFGVVITDSRTVPLRAGVTGAALGYSGFKGLRDYRGQKDIYGRKFRFSQLNIADSLSAAAVLVMGEGSERKPLAVIEKAPVVFASKTRKSELLINFEDDMYQPLLKNLFKPDQR